MRLDILVNGQRIDVLSFICNRDDADRRGRSVVKKLKAEIDRHMFEVAVQAAIGTRVIARETVPALRDGVAGCDKHSHVDDRSLSLSPRRVGAGG